MAREDVPRPRKQTLPTDSVKAAFAATTTNKKKVKQQEKPSKKVKVKHLGSSRIETETDEKIPLDLPNEVMASQVAFCCYLCFCSDEDKAKIPENDQFIQSGDLGLYHRRCCHNIVPRTDENEEEWEERLTNWMSPFEHASENVWAENEQEVVHHVMSMFDLQNQSNNSIPHQSAIYNADGNPDFTSVLQTSIEYENNGTAFRKMGKRTNDAVVLDMFAGIGCGIIALKRLGIAMKRVIHVEHDPVATHVYKWNHDSSYNEALISDEIDHMSFEKFEQFEDDTFLEGFLSQYGSIDIVIGGPPCVDYSGLNAYRKGTKGTQGSYMPRFGELIQRIQNYQVNHHVFFLAENTILRAFDLLQEMEKSYGVQWAMHVNASFFSPCRRDRTYISNIPCDTRNDDYVIDEDLVDSRYLTDGYAHCAHCVSDHLHQPRSAIKVNCFLASKSRIDAHPAMTVVKKNVDSDDEMFVEYRPYSVEERETIMGMPVGYVGEAANELFKELIVAHGKTLTTEPYWKDTSPPRYHHFGGLPFRLYSAQMLISLMLQPPKVNYNPADDPDADDQEQSRKDIKNSADRKDSDDDDPDSEDDENNEKQSTPRCKRLTNNIFYNEEQYSKRLIGNSFSIPVVEILLRQLQSKFNRRDYPLYNYQYVWRTPKVSIKAEDDS